ncbi:MAG TPA: tetratricopeptide repeat protein [Longimicrobium sp.]
MKLPRLAPLLAAALAVLSAHVLAAQPQPQIRRATMMFPSAQHPQAAMEHFAAGQHDMDFGNPVSAREHFAMAVQADPAFAFAYLQLAENANSLDEFRANLERAEANAAQATPAERLLIQMARKDLDNDVQGELTLAQQLVAAQPNTPRALMELARVQALLGREEDARATLRQATQAAAQFAPALMTLANQYLAEPRDLPKAEEAIRVAVAAAPDESYVYDVQGDVFRMQGQLEAARAAYTRSAQLAPREGSPLQQRGHVNSFLGRYDQARADYETAAALGRGNEKATYPVWRALVSVHQGNPRAAVEELDRLVASIDGMNVPDPLGSKIFALETEAVVALHANLLDAAGRAVTQRNQLAASEAEGSGSANFRRRAEANAAYWEGMLAARRGDYAAAGEAYRRYMTAVEPLSDPRKAEAAHELMGMIELLQQHYAQAAAHFEHADPNDPYATYHRALALDGAGRADEARRLFQRVAEYHFNNAGIALVQKDAVRRAETP